MPFMVFIPPIWEWINFEKQKSLWGIYILRKKDFPLKGTSLKGFSQLGVVDLPPKYFII